MKRRFKMILITILIMDILFFIKSSPWKYQRGFEEYYLGPIILTLLIEALLMLVYMFVPFIIWFKKKKDFTIQKAICISLVNNLIVYIIVTVKPYIIVFSKPIQNQAQSLSPLAIPVFIINIFTYAFFFFLFANCYMFAERKLK